MYQTGEITKMWCEADGCGKEFSAKQYFESDECCPFCGSEDGFSWDAVNVEDHFDEDDFDDDQECQCNATGCPECDARYYENFDCGMDASGQCGKAGSEECDWECPNN